MPEFFSLLSPATLFLLLNLLIGTVFITSRFTSGRKTGEEEHRRPPPLVRAPSLIDRVKSINLSFHKFSPFDSDTPPGNFSDHPPPLERAPSLLERLKSVNFSSIYRSEPEPEHAGEAEIEPELANRSKSASEKGVAPPPYNFSDHPPPLERAPSLLERLKSVNLASLNRSSLAPEIAGEAEIETELANRSISERRAAPERKEAERMRKAASEKGVAAPAAEERRPGTVRLGKTTSFGDEGVDAKADDFINRFKHQLKLQRLDSLLRYRDMLRGKQ